MNAPKELYHDVLFIVDEAHVFAPEGKPSEASGALESLASQGRKRGFCAIFATQRISKISKDVLAECNNKMIGRMNLDIDRKRAGEELGFTSKEQVLSLRQLKPGEFHIFGPAISNDVILTQVGDVVVPPPKRGAKRTLKSPPPTAAVKKILGELADLPEAAQKEATTIAELKAEISTLQRHKCEKGASKAEIEAAVAQAIKDTEDRKEGEFWEERTKWLEQIHNWFEILKSIGESMQEWERAKEKTKKPSSQFMVVKPEIHAEAMRKFQLPPPIVIGSLKMTKERVFIQEPASLGGGERKVLQAIAQFPDGITREHLTVLTGYKRSSRDTYIQRLKGAGYISQAGDYLCAVQDGIDALGSDYRPLPTGAELRQHWIDRLPEGERKILEVAISEHPHAIDREKISEMTGYLRSSRDTYIQRLAARQLIVRAGSMVKAADTLF
jgi:hypothetical protein